MKRLILGQKGSGKTKFIVDYIIPILAGNYKVFDFCDEYEQLIGDRSKIKKIDACHYDVVKEEVLKSNNETCLILENSEILIKPVKKEGPERLSWLITEAPDDLNIIVVAQTARAIIAMGLENYFDEIYWYETIDSDDIWIPFAIDKVVNEKTLIKGLHRDSLSFP